MTSDLVDGMSEKFAAFHNNLRGFFGDAVYQSWLASLALDAYDDGEATLSVQSGAQADRVNQRHRTLVRSLFCEQFGPVRKFSVVARGPVGRSFGSHAEYRPLCEGPNGRFKADGARVPAISVAMGGVERARGSGPVGSPSVPGVSPDVSRGSGAVAVSANAIAPDLSGEPRVTRGVAGFDFGAPLASSWSPDGSGARPGALNPPLSVADMRSPLHASSTFDTYAEDVSNEFALKAAQSVISGQGAGLVYICGASGVGKSHLLNAIGHEWSHRFPEKPFAYIKHANLRDGLKVAARNGSLYALMQEFLSCDLIMCDDVHRLHGSKRTLEELANLIDAFAEAGKQLVIVGDRLPEELATDGFDRILTDRLSGGLVAEVQRGGEGLRMEVLKKRRDRTSTRCLIDDDAIQYIAHHSSKSMREAIGMFNQLTLVHGEQAVKIGAVEAQNTLRSHLRAPAKTSTVDDALEAAAAAFSLSVADLKGRNQQQKVVRGRHAFVLVGREFMKESFPALSKALNRDHTTAMSGYQRALALHEREETFRARCEQIRASLSL